MKKLVILGAGGHARVVADCAQAMNKYKDIVFIDDSFPERKKNLAWPIVDKLAHWKDYIESAEFIVAIGNNDVRLSLSLDILKHNGILANIIHPQAIISPHISLGLGNMIFAGAIINAGSTIKTATIINTAATVDHDCILENGVHLSPGVNLAGTVHIGEKSWLGVGSNVIQCTKIAANTQTGAGTTVIKNTEANSLYVGTPAKRIR